VERICEMGPKLGEGDIDDKSGESIEKDDVAGA